MKPSEYKHFTLDEIFSRTELKQIQQLWRDSTAFHTDVKQEIITDKKLAELKKQGYEFNRDYLAYAIEYVFINTGGKNGKF